MSGADEQTVEQIAKLYDRHDERTTRVQRVANRMTSALGKPISLLIVFGLAAAWMIGNHMARVVGGTAVEEFPFPDLGLIATIVALLVSLLILTTQRHQEELAESRAQLMLHFATISERKITKVIELLEEQRRDNPLLRSRPDHEADVLARPSDHEVALSLIEEAQEGRSKKA